MNRQIFSNKQQNDRLAQLAKRNLGADKATIALTISESASQEAQRLSAFAYGWSAHFPVNSQIIAKLERMIYASELTGAEAIELYERHMIMSKMDSIIVD